MRSLWLPGPCMGHSAQRHLCREVLQGCIPIPCHEHTLQQRCRASAPVWRSSLLPKSWGSYLLPQTPPVHAGRCPQDLQAGDSSQFPIPVKAASSKVSFPLFLDFHGPSSCAPADRQHKCGDSGVSEAIMQGIWVCVMAPVQVSARLGGVPGIHKFRTNGQSLFQPGESWLCEMCPLKPGHMVALAVENFMCIICLPQFCWWQLGGHYNYPEFGFWAAVSTCLLGGREKICLQTACSLMSSKCACPFPLIRTMHWEIRQRINEVDIHLLIYSMFC